MKEESKKAKIIIYEDGNIESEGQFPRNKLIELLRQEYEYQKAHERYYLNRKAIDDIEKLVKEKGD